MMPANRNADDDLLHKLLLGRLPSAEVERLAVEYADDSRLAALAESLAGKGDTLLDSLRHHATQADSTAERLVERLLERLQTPQPFDETVVGAPSDVPAEGLVPTAGRATQVLPERLEYFRILQLLGKGGMGTVFLAEDTRLGRQVAVKTLRPELAADPRARERFLREARTAAKLEHDHIIPIYYVGESYGTPFLAMPLLKGESLHALLERTAGPLPVAQAVRLAHEVAAGLAAAHDQGLIHRDIKPANLWLEAPSARVKILDFGLARSQTDDVNLTALGALIGTPAYMAPEQARGESVDYRADLFSLGCVLYEMLTGQKPFTGPSTMAILSSLALETPKSPRSLNPQCSDALSLLVMKLLEKDPAARPASAQEIIKELAEAGGETGPTSEVLKTSEVSSPDPKPRRRWPLIAAAVLLVGLVVGLIFRDQVSRVGAQIIRFATNKGELVIEVDDPTVEVKIVQNGVVVQDATGKREFTLKAGDGEIEVLEKEGARLATKKFELTRGGKTTVKVTLQELANARDPDRRAAEWALSIGGTIKIREHDQENDKVVTELPRNEFQLRVVTLNDNPRVNDTGLAHFKGCENVTHVYLHRTQAGDAGVAHFKDCKNLQVLALNSTRVSDAGLAYFKGFKHLMEVVLNDGQVSDVGLVDFIDSPKLLSVKVKNTKVTEAGVKKLAAALPLCKIEWDGGVIEPTASADPDRRAAEWVLSIGGSVGIKENGKERQIKAAGELPRGPFELTGVVVNQEIKLSDSGLAFFKDCKSITTLQLCRAEFSDAGLGHFKDCKNLTALNLGETNVRDAGLAHFKDCKDLKALELNNTGISDAGLIHFKDCKNLELLNLASTRVSESGLTYFKAFRNLTRLDLSRTQVSDAGLAHIKDCKGLAWLDLGRTQVSDVGLAHIKNCKCLAVLSLASTRVSDVGLAHIKDCKNLTWLALSSTQVSDAGLVHLAGCSKLASLNVKNTKVTETGVKKLSAAVPVCKIEWDGGAIEPTASADPDRRAAEWVLSIGSSVVIKTNEAQRQIVDVADLPLTSFDLISAPLNSNQKVSDAGLAHFANCKNLVALSLSHTPATDAGLANFKKCTKLESIILLNQSQITDAGIDHFKDCTRLSHLNLRNTQVSDAGLARFQDLSKLEFLNLDGTKVTDTGLAHFAACKNLGVLELVSTRVTDAGLVHFKDCKKLVSMDLHNTGVGDAGLAHFKECRDLNTVNLEATKVSDAALIQLAGCSKLRFVNVKNTNVTDAGVKKLAAALPLCKIQWNGPVIEPTVSADPDRRAAEWVLSIGGTVKLNENGQERQTEAAGELPRGMFELTVVDLNHNSNVSDAGLAHFKDCKNLTYLGLASTNVSDAGLAHFKDCKNLTAIRLDGTRISDTGAGLAYFKDCKNLAILQLGATQVSDAGLAHFKDCKNLTGLDLGSTTVSDAGLAYFKDCKKLTYVYLSGTKVTDAGLAQFKDHKNLTFLNLDSTQASDAGLAHFIGCPKLVSVTVKNAKVTQAGVKNLGAALPGCKIEWDGGTIDPTPSVDRDRRAAEWVLSIGGGITIRENGRQREVKAGGALPGGTMELTVAGLNQNPTVTDAGLAHFKDCKSLTQLYLGDTRVSDVGLAHFKDCKKLTNLQLFDTKVSDAGLAHFKDCKNLMVLHLGRTKVTDAGLSHFKDCKNLTHLDLDFTQVSNAGLAQFKDCKNLSYLILNDTQVTDAGLAYFKDCKDLTHLDVHKTQVTDAGLAHLRDCKNLSVLYLDATGVTNAGLAYIKDFKNLSVLRLYQTQVSDAGLAHLKGSESLMYLHLGGLAVSDAGLAHLKDCKNLTELYLINTRVTDDGLAQLKNCKRLSILDMSSTQVSDVGLAYLKDCKNLTTLNIKGTKARKAGIDNFAAALPMCKIIWDGGEIAPK